MKKLVCLIFLSLLLTSLTLAQDDLPVTEQDAQKIQEGLDKLPINEDGEIDNEKISGYKSNAELRIEAINNWLKQNASWLKIIFGMVPEISWLFLINLYFILFFFLTFVLNSQKIWFFLKENYAIIFGIIIFILGLVSKIYTNILARPLHNLIFNYILTIETAIILYITIGIIIIASIGLQMITPKLLTKFYEWQKKRKEAKAMAEQELNRKALRTLVNRSLQKPY